jgi:dTMP kinase
MVAPMSKLIVLEGLDGAGTTTQARLLAQALTERGRAVHVTRQPSDGPIGKLLRAMLTGGHAIEGQAIDQRTFGLLFAADRMDHGQREVAPALAAGTLVISDRWYHSSLAYQGTGAARAWIAACNQHARQPDVTVFLRVRPEVAAARRAAGRTEELFEAIEMQRKVAAGYDRSCTSWRSPASASRWSTGGCRSEEVTSEILAGVLRRIGGTN